MTRTISSSNRQATEAAHVIPVLFARLDFASGLVLANSTPFSFTFASETYLGVGEFGAVSVVRETSSVEATHLTLQLSGLSPTLINTALTEDYHGRDARLYAGFLTDANALIDTPLLLYRGRMDTMRAQAGRQNIIYLEIESRLADLLRPRIRRYNHNDQTDKWPDDPGLEFVEQTVDKELNWKLK